MGLEIANNTIKVSTVEYNNEPVRFDPFSTQTSGSVSLPGNLGFSMPEEFSFHFLTKSEIDSLPGWTYYSSSYISYSRNGISFAVYLEEPQSNGIFYNKILIGSLRINFPQQVTEVQIPLTGTCNEYDMANVYGKIRFQYYTNVLKAYLRVEAADDPNIDDEYSYSVSSGNWSGTLSTTGNTLDINSDLTVNETAEFKKNVIFQDSTSFQKTASFSGTPVFNSKKVGSVTFLYDNWHDYGKNSYCNGSVGKLLSPDALYVLKGVSGTLYPLRSDIGHQSRIFDATEISLYSSMPKIPTSEIHLQFMMEMSVNYYGDSSIVTFYVTSVDTNIDCKVSASTNSAKKCTSDLVFDIYEILKFN